jgi:hypothetical protein
MDDTISAGDFCGRNIFVTDDVLVINQHWPQGLDVQVSLLNKRVLRVEKIGNRPQKYTVDLLALNGQSDQKIIIAWRWVVAGVAMLVLAGMCDMFLPVLAASPIYTILLYITGLGTSGGCFYLAWKGTSRKQLYRSRSADVVLVELAVNNPSKKEFEYFIRTVENCIASSREGLTISRKNQLAGEMKMLRRLSKEGVISESTYAKAKTGLLNQH